MPISIDFNPNIRIFNSNILNYSNYLCTIYIRNIFDRFFKFNLTNFCFNDSINLFFSSNKESGCSSSMTQECQVPMDCTIESNFESLPTRRPTILPITI